jgi:hypothetical protein
VFERLVHTTRAKTGQVKVTNVASAECRDEFLPPGHQPLKVRWLYLNATKSAPAILTARMVAHPQLAHLARTTLSRSIRDGMSTLIGVP